MDDTNRLIVELQAKLEELDHRVAAYCQDMTAEYVKHADLLLSEVPDDISKSVRSALQESFVGYPLLFPASSEHLLMYGAEKSRDIEDEAQIATPTMPLSIFSEEQQGDTQSRSHEREAELTGLFTPSYLPLLDSTPRDERRSSSEVMASPRTIPKGKAATSVETLSLRPGAPPSASSSYTPESPLSKPPTPRRRNTEDFSGGSSQNSLPKRRSAMRRTSSSGKAHSPRRVRFDFEGELFTTTQSPRPPTPILIAAETNTPITELSSDSDSEAAAEQVEDVNEQPAPRRVSSTQALQALSRHREEEEGVQWTQVSAPSDGSASVEGEPTDSDEDDFLDMSSKRPLSHKNNALLATSPGKSDILPKYDHVRRHDPSICKDAVGKDSAGLEDTLVETPPPQPMLSSSVARMFVSDTNVPVTSGRVGDFEAFSQSSRSKDWLVTPLNHKGGALSLQLNPVSHEMSEGEEALFDFDETTHSNSASEQRTALAPHQNDGEDEDEEEEGEDDEDSGIEGEADHGGNRSKPSTSGAPHANLSLYATSPARAIARSGPRSIDLMGSMPSTGTMQLPAGKAQMSAAGNRRSIAEIREKTTSPSPNAMDSMSGRLMHPWNTPVVNSSAHAQAAQMGDIHSFVGSLNGKSGPDESQANVPAAIGSGSFRAGSLGGKPRSLSERMMMDDYMDARDREKDRIGDCI